jgi:hypothetical protein
MTGPQLLSRRYVFLACLKPGSPHRDHIGRVIGAFIQGFLVQAKRGVPVAFGLGRLALF